MLVKMCHPQIYQKNSVETTFFSTLVCISTLEGSKNRLQFLSEDFSFFLYRFSSSQQNHRYCFAALHKIFAQFNKDTRSPLTYE